MKLVTLKKYFQSKSALIKGLAILLMFFATDIFAANQTLGSIAGNITKNFSSLTQLITACSYIAGIGFAVGAIIKFKQHKDNPTQVTIGTPIALIFVAAALLFLPSILNVTSATLFGSGGGTVAGASGTVYS